MDIDFDKYYKYMFIIAAIWNISFGIIIALFYPTILPLIGVTVPNTPKFIQGMCALIIVFGVGFILTALNPEGNKGFVRVAAIEKIMAFLLFYYYATNGNPWTLFTNPLFFFASMNYNILLMTKAIPSLKVILFLVM